MALFSRFWVLKTAFFLTLPTLLTSCGSTNRITFAVDPLPDSGFFNEAVVRDSNLVRTTLINTRDQIVSDLVDVNVILKLAFKILKDGSKRQLKERRIVSSSLSKFFERSTSLTTEIDGILAWYRDKKRTKTARKIAIKSKNPLELATPFKELISNFDGVLLNKDIKAVEPKIASFIAKIKTLISQFMLIVYSRLNQVVISLKPVIDSWNLSVEERVTKLTQRKLTISEDLSYVKRLSFERFEDNINSENIRYFISLLTNQPLLLIDISNLPKLEIADYLYLNSLLAKPLLEQLLTPSSLFKDRLKVLFLLVNSQAINLHQDLANLQVRLSFFLPLAKDRFKQITNSFKRLESTFIERKSLLKDLRENHIKIEDYLREYTRSNLEQLAHFDGLTEDFYGLSKPIIESRFKYEDFDFYQFLDRLNQQQKPDNLTEDIVLIDEKTDLKKGEKVIKFSEIFKRLEADVANLKSLIKPDSASSFIGAFGDLDVLINYLDQLRFNGIYGFLKLVQDSNKRLDRAMSSTQDLLKQFQTISTSILRAIKDFFFYLFALQRLISRYPTDTKLASLLKKTLTFFEDYSKLLSQNAKALEGRAGKDKQETIINYLNNRENLLVWLSDLRLALFALIVTLRSSSISLLDEQVERGGG